MKNVIGKAIIVESSSNEFLLKRMQDAGEKHLARCLDEESEDYDLNKAEFVRTELDKVSSRLAKISKEQ